MVTSEVSRIDNTMLVVVRRTQVAYTFDSVLGVLDEAELGCFLFTDFESLIHQVDLRLGFAICVRVRA